MRKIFTTVLIIAAAILLVSPALLKAQPRTPPQNPYTPPATKPSYERSAVPLQTILLAENFDSTSPGDLPPGWTAYALGDSGPGQWEVYDDLNSYSPPNDVFHGYGTGNEDYDDWLVTPQIDLAGYGNVQLTFYYREEWLSWYVYHGVWVSTGSPDPADGDYVEIQEIAPTVEGEWVPVTLDLSAFSGQKIYIAFVYRGLNADDWYIDDVVVSGEPLPAEFSPSIYFIAALSLFAVYVALRKL